MGYLIHIAELPSNEPKQKDIGVSSFKNLDTVDHVFQFMKKKLEEYFGSPFYEWDNLSSGMSKGASWYMDDYSVEISLYYNEHEDLANVVQAVKETIHKYKKG